MSTARRHSYPPQDMSRHRHAYHHQPSRKKRKDAYFRLLELPAEIRFLVIEFSLPPINDVSKHWPAPIPALLRTSKQINIDTKEAMTKWSPMHYIPEPFYFDVIPQPGAVRVENLCLPMFHDARLGVLRSGVSTRTLAGDHQDLIATWMNNVNKLPRLDTIKTIIIDATPAPGWLRYEKPSWLSRLVNDKAVSDRFVYEHIQLLANFMADIAVFYNSLEHPVNIELAGFYGLRSTTFPEYVLDLCRMQDVDVSFTGSFLPEQRCRVLPETVEGAISELYSTRGIPPDRYLKQRAQIVNARRRLLEYTYTPTTEFLFQNCHEDNESWTMVHLGRITDFVLAENRRPKYIDLYIPDFARRSFVVSLAKDLDLGTTTVDRLEGHDLRVYRKRRSRTRDLGRTEKGSTFVTDLIVTGVALLAFLAVVRSQSRADRRRG